MILAISFECASGGAAGHRGGAGGPAHGVHVVSLQRGQGRQSEGPHHERRVQVQDLEHGEQVLPQDGSCTNLWWAHYKDDSCLLRSGRRGPVHALRHPREGPGTCAAAPGWKPQQVHGAYCAPRSDRSDFRRLPRPVCFHMRWQ